MEKPGVPAESLGVHGGAGIDVRSLREEPLEDLQLLEIDREMHLLPIPAADGTVERVRQRGRGDALFQLRPVGEAVLASDDPLRIA